MTSCFRISMASSISAPSPTCIDLHARSDGSHDIPELAP